MEVFITEDYSRNEIAIWVMEDTPSGRKNFTIVDGALTAEEFDPGKVREYIPIKPFISLPLSGKIGPAVIKKLTEYAINSGYKPKDEHLIEGKLIATEKHLEDMRLITSRLLDFKLEGK